MLWVARPEPVDVSQGIVSVIDPATNRIARSGAIRRTFNVRAGAGALWYVDGTDLVRLDTKTLRTTVVRSDATVIVAISGGGIWLQTATGVVEVDARTGTTIGRVIRMGPVVNATGHRGRRRAVARVAAELVESGNGHAVRRRRRAARWRHRHRSGSRSSGSS